VRFIVSLLILLGRCDAAHRTKRGAGAWRCDYRSLRLCGSWRTEDSAWPAWRAREIDRVPITNEALFALPSLLPVRKAIDGEFERYITKQQKWSRERGGRRGSSFDLQLFDRALLYSRDTRFVAASSTGWTAPYVSPDSCGEIRRSIASRGAQPLRPAKARSSPGCR